jgi:hypothetical protein
MPIPIGKAGLDEVAFASLLHNKTDHVVCKHHCR